MKKIRMLTYHNARNNGAVLQAYSLLNSLRYNFKTDDVRILDYKPKELELYELLKIFKLYKKSPLFNSRRYFLFNKFIGNNLSMDKNLPIFQRSYEKIGSFMDSQHYDALIVGSDAIWKLAKTWSLPKFPNIYWLSNKISAKKIAYAASAHGSDLNLVDQYRDSITNCLNAFDLIGVRDDFTFELVKECDIDKTIPVYKVPDPTFLYEIRKTDVNKILINSGIDLDKPILGILIYGKADLSKKIKDYFKLKGFQIVALSMYNPYADLNLGHVIDPFEWAEVFKYLTFCITDRFHGSIFCLKNKTPFISIESTTIPKNSKRYSLLKDFDMVHCYYNLSNSNFDMKNFIENCERIAHSWNDYEKKVDSNLEAMQERGNDYIEKIKEVFGNA